MRRACLPLLVSALLVASACGAQTDEHPEPAVESATAPAPSQETPSQKAPSEEAAPDVGVLRLRATQRATTRSCAPQDVVVTLTPVEPALGHRYARVVLRNVTDSACVVEGFPGIGGRGESGDPLEFAAEQRQRTGERTSAEVVSVPPAGEAYANVEWTGNLAGAETERITALALQVAGGQPPVVARTAESLDIGNGTTVRIGPWEAAETQQVAPASHSAPAERVASACTVGPRRTPSGVKRFWTTDKRCYTSRWFAGAHRRMIPFGCTRAPWYPPSGRCTGGKGFHHGLDLDMPRGTRVYAAVSGRVVTRGLGSAYGSRAVVIRSRGRDVLLGHLRSRRVKHGERVSRGDLIGRSGARGAPDGPHLHVEVRPARGSYRTAVSPRRTVGLTVAR